MRMGSELRSNLTRMGWSLNVLISCIVSKNVVMIQAASSGTALLPVVGACMPTTEAECLLYFRKIQASDGEP